MFTFGILVRIEKIRKKKNEILIPSPACPLNSHNKSGTYFLLYLATLYYQILVRLKFEQNLMDDGEEEEETYLSASKN
jgi:hypothetical protein